MSIVEKSIVNEEGVGRSVVGTWRLLSVPTHDAAGRALPPSYGPEPLGTVTFAANGRMACVLIDGRETIADGEVREYTSYCGSYTIEGDTLTTRVDAASDASRLVDQVRRFRFEGEQLVLTPPPRQWSGAMQHRELLWERLGGAARNHGRSKTNGSSKRKGRARGPAFVCLVSRGAFTCACRP